MGITCEINLCKPADGRYTYQPGSIVSGEIRYYLHEEYEFTSITVSLRGIGHLSFEDSSDSNTNTYTDDEIYVDLNNVIHDNEKKEPLPVGQYETHFGFQLPYNIPASIDYKKKKNNYKAKCYVKYFIRIKFARPGWFQLNKKYKKEINVISEQMPRLTTDPLVYGDQKNLVQLKSLFSSKKDIVNLKAVIANSVLRPGEYVRIDYEIRNDTNAKIKDVQVSMAEVDQYTPKGKFVGKVHTEIKGILFLHEAIPGGETAKFSVQFMVPDHCASIDHCRFLSRDYSIITLVRLPVPHINQRLEIPFQVIQTSSSSFDNACFSNGEMQSDDPPSYWEAMAEDTKNSSESKESIDSKGDDALKEKEGSSSWSM